MSVEPRTIDNLGIATSNRYAKDKAVQDKKLVEEARFISSKTEISVLKPYYPRELQEYFFLPTTNLWASFEPPPNYLSALKGFFSHALIPSLGSSEDLEADKDRLEALEDSLEKSFKGGSDSEQDHEDQQEAEKERQVLLHLMKTLGKLDRVLEMINSRRHQYQRG